MNETKFGFLRFQVANRSAMRIDYITTTGEVDVHDTVWVRPAPLKTDDGPTAAPSASFVSGMQNVMDRDRDHCGTVNNTQLPPMVWQTATVFFVANKCADTDRLWKSGDGVARCDRSDAVRHISLRRGVVRATIQFQK